MAVHINTTRKATPTNSVVKLNGFIISDSHMTREKVYTHSVGIHQQRLNSWTIANVKTSVVVAYLVSLLASDTAAVLWFVSSCCSNSTASSAGGRSPVRSLHVPTANTTSQINCTNYMRPKGIKLTHKHIYCKNNKQGHNFCHYEVSPKAYNSHAGGVWRTISVAEMTMTYFI